LRHREKRCTRGRIGGRRRHLEALSRHGPVTFCSQTIFSRPHVSNPPSTQQTLKGWLLSDSRGILTRCGRACGVLKAEPPHWYLWFCQPLRRGAPISNVSR
jgi:hypothetical protein